MIKETEKEKKGETNVSLEERLIAKLKTLEDIALKNLEYKKKDYPNFFKTYELTKTALTPLHFELDTGGYPLTHVYVISVGGGLWLGINGNEEFSVIDTEEIKGDIGLLHYKVFSGKAYILCQARVD